MADMGSVGSIHYDVEMNTGKLLEGERKATASMNKVASTANKVAAAVTAAFAGITLAAFADKLVKVQRQFDILNAGLITATGSVDNAAAAFETLQKFAATTPYSIDQAVTAFTRLTNLGLDPSIKSLTAYGNTASAMGKDLMQMIEAVADASTGEFERLKEFGIRASKQGDNVSLTFKGVTETVKFSAENIQKYLLNLAETNFAGAMDQRAKTLDGAISNLSDSWDQLFLTVSKSGVGEEIARGVRLATTAINELERSIEAGSLTSYFDEALPYIEALKVAGTSLAAVYAGRLVSAMTASAGATVAATIAKRAALAEAVRVTEAELAQAQAAARVATATAAMGGSSAAAAAAQSRLATATAAATAAQTAYASSATAAGIALRGWGTLLGAMGGWVGIAVTALTLLAFNWDKVSGAAESAAKISENAADRIRRALSGASATPMRDLIDGMSKAQKDLAEIDKQLASGKKYTTTVGPRAFEEQRALTKEEIASLTERREALRGAVVDYQKARDDLKASQIAGLFPDKPPEPNKPAGGTGGGTTTKKEKFDSQGYINDLVIANADGLAKIDAQEKDALDKAKKLLNEKKISQQQYEQAVTLIRLAASKDREELIKRQADEEKEKIKERIAAEEYAADATKSLAQQELDSFDSAYNQRLEKLKELHEKGLISEQAYADAVANINKQKEENKNLQMQKVVDPIAALEIEQAKKLELFDSYAAQLLEKEISSETAIQEARTALVADHEAQRQALAEQTFRSQSEGNAFLMDSLDALKGTATNALTGLIDGTMTGKEAMIALGRTIRDQAIQALVEMGIQYVKNLIISKTVGAATTTLAATQAGIVATAWAPAAALSSLATLGTNAVAAQAGILATTGIAKMAAVAGGRQYGGPVAADSLYRVNETGAPEMFTASNGRQYMMPNTRGEVTPANKLGGGVTINIVNTMADATVTATSSDSGTVDITVQRAVAEVASQIASNSGQVWSAMKGATNVQSKL